MKNTIFRKGIFYESKDRYAHWIQKICRRNIIKNMSHQSAMSSELDLNERMKDQRDIDDLTL